ncbi:UDP-N-acetylmuramoyl-L-alanyl-D-glutamate--2,6-diaminopimelate ligase [Alkalihalobacillus pseudalcaliphilus]|uniref:UDP-N-acetylmuramoyl-L-alanyl-D-glutamate--2, 6-diaminopimelate ligase n=1 Tax=Alkalihalobacillus pseudalcaliphilus TaxID=79884 RepID=UPI00064DB392|nr:UDP-N-acetylmuramoyl-L-alanyl-D-glutamate--2,6-diaminopimelate ligase [Alkalihalobacillus pseudalcaliphilus]KMK75341.1 UDP-N-acetylmuramoylalanyl-D-glutamate--2,6-diaminopimelate ligase [Alkalihalobacillus pseudalcaliphilus]
MNLRILANLTIVKKIYGNIDIEITGIEMDSRKVHEGILFVCVPGIEGFLADRHDFALNAVQNGASALITERFLDIDIPQIVVKNARQAMAFIANHLYEYPSSQLSLIGITGTNGKTTTAHMIDKILSDYGHKTGLMGNIGVKINKKVYPTELNTHEPPSLQKYLRKMTDEYLTHCVMEVSSQGLDMNRVLGCDFNIAILTNITHEHLDYHGTFEKYLEAKAQLFIKLGQYQHPSNKKIAILNADDPSLHYIKTLCPVEVITYGINHPADVIATNIQLLPDGIQFNLSTFNGDSHITLGVVGQFNIYNALAAITAALVEGIPLSSIKESLATFQGVPGRMELIHEGQDFHVIVDYAHTPDALEKALQTLNDFAIGRIITVFGSAGERDKEKRPFMGAIVDTYSDFSYITSDNPCHEEPLSIIEDIKKGYQSDQYKIILDREEAIQQAIANAQENDIIFLAGKGHETYQIINDKKVDYNERELARKYSREAALLKPV